ncbi:ankyrin repeat domain-containing protein [Wolbachia endosymbiont (group B) of Chesias legatella]|uniref:ankyrin repeat domain-containing protein n=1 Tax=Wolbachia endosymbiont (group B) of Chesias legatella TaxID=3066167 RepID=UPI0031331A9D
MLNSNQIAHDSNGFEDTTSRGFEGLLEEGFKVINEKNQVIDSLKSKIENLQQENFDLKKNLELQKYYKKRAEEYYEEVIELTREIQTLTGKIKRLEVTMEKQERKARNICEESEGLEQQVEKLKRDLEDESRTKNSTINLLNEELKNEKDNIYYINIEIKELNQDLDQAKALINRLKERLGEKEKQLEDLTLANAQRYSLDINHLRSAFDQKVTENHYLTGELKMLHKKWNSLKLQLQQSQSSRSLLDELSETNIKTENDCDKGGCSQESDLGYASFLDGIKPESSSEQKCLEPNRPLNLEKQDLTRELNALQKENEDLKLKALHLQPGRSLLDELSEANIKADKLTKTEISYDRGNCNQKEIHYEDEFLDEGYHSLFEQGKELSAKQEWLAANKLLDEEYELIKKYLWIPSELSRGRSLLASKYSFEELVCIWLACTANLTKNQKKLNKELLKTLKGIGCFYQYDTDKLEKFLKDNKNDQDLKVVLNLKRGESGLTLLHAASKLNHDGSILVDLLLQAGADPNIKSNEGKTPLHYAANRNYAYPIIDLLLEGKANPNIQDNTGKTPLQTVIDNNNVNSLECFLTKNQKKLSKEVYDILLGTVLSKDSKKPHMIGKSANARAIENLEKFLNKHNSSQDLKMIFTIQNRAGMSKVLSYAKAACKEAEDLLLKAGATHPEKKDSKIHSKERKCLLQPSTLWNIQNQEIVLDRFLNEISQVKDMEQLEKLVNKAIVSGIVLNFAKKSSKNKKYNFLDYVTKKINRLEKNSKVANDIIYKLVARGAVFYSQDSMEVMITLESEFKDHKTNIIKAYKDYIRKTHKFIEVAKSATNCELNDIRIDNSNFYLEYSEDSIIDVAKVTNKVRDLVLTQKEIEHARSVIKIGKSEVEIITQGGIRNYTDLADGSDIVLTFDTSFGELEVRLYPDKENENLVIVEVNDEDLLEEVENYDEKIGKNCLLGGLSVSEAINRGSFDRSRGLIHSEKMKVASNFQETQATLHNEGTRTIL